MYAGGSKFPKLYLQYYSEDYRGVHSLTKINKKSHLEKGGQFYGIGASRDDARGDEIRRGQSRAGFSRFSRAFRY